MSSGIGETGPMEGPKEMEFFITDKERNIYFMKVNLMGSLMEEEK